MNAETVIQMNMLAVDYKDKPSEEVFARLYEVLTQEWKKHRVLHRLSNRYSLTYNDVDSVANLCIYESIGKFSAEVENANFYKFVSVALSRKCIDEFRRIKKTLDDVSLEPQEPDDYNDNCSILDFIPRANAEDEAIENLQKESDQHQLIADLLDNASDKCRQALEAFVKFDFSYVDAAKHLGVKRDTVKDRIEKISRSYSPKKHGHLYDYFTEAV